MRAAFYTLGCKVNQYETQIMTQQFAAYGYDIVDSGDHADVYVINSCTVTASGDKKTRQMIHRMKRENPGAAQVFHCVPCFIDFPRPVCYAGRRKRKGEILCSVPP